MHTKLLLYLLTIIPYFAVVSCRPQKTVTPSISVQQEGADLYALIADVEIDSPFFNTAEAPDNCQPKDVALRVAELFQAINNKELDTLPTFFNEASFAFLWRGELGEEQLTFLNLEELSRFLDSRYAQNEMLTLTRIRVNGWERERNVVHFGAYRGRRTADDLPEQDIFGKGALNCENETFTIIGVGPEPPSLIAAVDISSPLFNYDEAPINCRPKDVTMRLAELFQAINNKELDTLSTFFNEASFTFLWRGKPGAEAVKIFQLEELSRFLDSRYAQNETLTLTRVQVNNWERKGNIIYFDTYRGRRTADDLPEQNIFGKGVFYCEKGTFTAITITP